MTTATNLPTQAEEVKAELVAMKEIGLRVPAKALKYCDTHADELNSFQAMKISQIADYVVSAC
jgi:hypothetical protein